MHVDMCVLCMYYVCRYVCVWTSVCTAVYLCMHRCTQLSAQTRANMCSHLSTRCLSSQGLAISEHSEDSNCIHPTPAESSTQSLTSSTGSVMHVKLPLNRQSWHKHAITEKLAKACVATCQISVCAALARCRLLSAGAGARRCSGTGGNTWLKHPFSLLSRCSSHKD